MTGRVVWAFTVVLVALLILELYLVGFYRSELWRGFWEVVT